MSGEDRPRAAEDCVEDAGGASEDPPRHEAFIWPPRGGAAAASRTAPRKTATGKTATGTTALGATEDDSPHADPAPIEETPTAANAEPFADERPPRPTGASVDLDLRAAPVRPSWMKRTANLGGEIIREIERSWLGLVCAPFAIRARDAGWSPDPPEAYCHRCGSSIGPHETGGWAAPAPQNPHAQTRDEARAEPEPPPEGQCSACAGKRLAWSRFVRLADYEGLVRDAIHDLKFTAFRRVGTDLGRLLGATLAEEIRAARRDPSKVVLVPVSPSTRRRLSRGIDHTLAIARGMRRSAPQARLVTFLSRSHRRSQVDLAISKRRSNVSGAFRPRALARLQLWWARVPRSALDNSWTFVVIDDVRTTGATMTQACRAVAERASRGSPRGDRPQVWAAVVAVTPEPGRRKRDEIDAGSQPDA